MTKAKQINLQPSENPGKKSVSKELLHLGTSGTVVGQYFTSRLKDLLVHHPRTPVRGFIPPLFLAQPLQPCLPYPVKVGMVRQIIVGGNVAIAGTQNPHEQL